MSNHVKPSFWDFTKQSAREATREFFRPLTFTVSQMPDQTKQPSVNAAEVAPDLPLVESEQDPAGVSPSFVHFTPARHKAAPVRWFGEEGVFLHSDRTIDPHSKSFADPFRAEKFFPPMRSLPSAEVLEAAKTDTAKINALLAHAQRLNSAGLVHDAEQFAAKAFENLKRQAAK